MGTLNLSFETIIKYVQIVVDVALVWALIYFLIKIVRNNKRTVQLFQGVILIIIIEGVSSRLGLSTLSWLTDNIVSWGFVSLVVVFQPEIRSMLERLGKGNFFSRTITLTTNEKESLIDELIIAVGSMSKTKTGALISIEQGVSLDDYIKTGVNIKSDVKAELLCSIFVNKTPLHDGAVIIKGDKICCASAYFPPTNKDLPSRYGSRHRAAIGISEVSDAITIVVSEESGAVAVTYEGRIYSLNDEELRAFLRKALLNSDDKLNSSESKTKAREMKSFSQASFNTSDEKKYEIYDQVISSKVDEEIKKPVVNVVENNNKNE